MTTHATNWKGGGTILLWLICSIGNVAIAAEAKDETLGFSAINSSDSAKVTEALYRIRMTHEAMKIAAYEAVKQYGPQAKSDVAMRAACEVLGRMRVRDDKVIEILIRKIDWVKVNSISGSLMSNDVVFGKIFPVANTLSKIGKPAAGACLWELTKLGAPGIGGKREKLCWVIGMVEGPEVGRFLIRNQIQELSQAGGGIGRHSNKQKIQQLEKAFKVFEKLFPVQEKGTKN